MHDHRRLGRELDLFDTDPLIGAGLPHWLPAGAAVRHAIEEYIHEAERRAGYQHVHTPVLGNQAARHRLSLRGRGGKYVADSDVWDRAESILAAVLRARRMAHDAEVGEGAFYGPSLRLRTAAPSAHG